MKRIADFLLYGNMFIGLAASSLALCTLLIFNASISISLLLFIYSATVAVYTFHGIYSYRNIIQTGSPRIAWIINNKKILLLVFYTATLVAFVTSFWLSSFIYFLIIPLTVLSFFYTVSVPIGKVKYSIKQFPILKILIVGLVWTCVTVVTPWINSFQLNFLMFDWLYFLQIFLLIISLCIPFDIRDFGSDITKDNQTLPILASVKVAKLVAILTLTVFLIISGIIGNILTGIPVFLLSLLFILKARDGMPDLYYNFFGDGILLFYSLLFLIFN